MKGYNLYSYRPYKPLLRNIGDIYICRVAPNRNTIHFEWLDSGDAPYSIYCRAMGEEAFTLCGTTEATEFDITHLSEGKDYEFFVCAGEKKSLVRLARTGPVEGTVVNYIHPLDTAYAFSGHYLGSPGILRHPQGHLLASMDVFRGNYPMNLSLIFRSDDDGKTWRHVCELMPCLCPKLFLHKGELYVLAKSTNSGDLLISKSTDGVIREWDFQDMDKHDVRNCQSLLRSKDMSHWEVVKHLLDYRDQDPQQVGVQYTDFIFEGDDMLYLTRTALNGAHSFHDANYSVFHRLKNFRTNPTLE